MNEDDAYIERANALLEELENEASASAGGGAAYASSDPSGYYARLGVSPKATPQEIRRAFLFLSQRYHTDKHANQGTDVQSLMNDRFQQLQDAYVVLSDERQRAAYDAGGDLGRQRLSLVPAGLHRREDIVQYVLSLDREAQLLQTSKMTSAASQTTLNFSTAHFFPFQVAAADEDEEEEGEEEAKAAGGAAAEQGGAPAAGKQKEPAAVAQSAETKTTPTPSTGRGPAPAESKAAPSPPPAAAAGQDASAESASAKASGAGGSGGAPVQAQLTAKEVVIDGKRQVVLIPTSDVQEQLRRRMQGAGGNGAAAAPPSHGAVARASGRGGHPAFRQLSTVQAVMLAAIPKSMTFRSSFQHMLSPKLIATFRTDASARPRKSVNSLTTSLEYQPDGIRTYGTSLRFAVSGLKWCLMQRRELSPLWALKSKLTALTGAQLLQKLELTLIRKLSPSAELENALAMSLNEHGFFRCSVNDATEDAQQGVSAYIGFHNMYLTAYTAGKVILGVDTKDPKNPPAYGRLQYTVNCSPLAGQTTLGLEAWYCPSRLQHYGLGFTTVLPYAVSPVAPPFFLVESTQFATVNQISLLYARGQHRISIPIIVFISPKVSQGLAWMAAPLALYRIATMLYRPYTRAKAIRYYTTQRKAHIAETDVAREKARLEQLALESLVLMSRASEERKGGLVIINARYGVIDPQFAEVTPPVTPVARTAATPPPMPSPSPAAQAGAGSPSLQRRRSKATAKAAGANGWWPSQIVARVAEAMVGAWLRRRAPPAGGADSFEAAHDAVRSDAIPLSIDVTIAVQNLVRDSALTLPAGTKSTLVGFCDPDPFTPEEKSLKIVYWFRKRKHTAIFADAEEVELPQREHLMT